MVHDAILSKENISSFIKYQEEKGLAPETINSYESNLMLLYDFLPANDKTLSQYVLEYWIDCMHCEGLSKRTLNYKISICNNYLSYINRYDLQLIPFNISAKSSDDILTKNEYMRLLSAAKLLENERCYFLIRTIASTGIHVSDIDKVTVEFLKSDNAYITSPNGEDIRFSQIIKNELIDYSNRAGIFRGPVFVTQNGKPLDRASIFRAIVPVCHAARIPRTKSTPIKLRQYYLKTYKDTTELYRQYINETYDDLIRSEQMIVGWE